MQLFYSPNSPYVRKVILSAHVLGFFDDMTLDMVDWSDPGNAAKLVLNPLAKIPALIADGKLIADSRVIVEYLDARTGGGNIIPADSDARIQELSRAALIEGMTDSSIQIVYETLLRAENMVVESIMERHREKIVRGLGVLGGTIQNYDNGKMPMVAELGLAALLDYLDFRNIVPWRDHTPHLADWMASFAAHVPGYHASLPEGLNSAPYHSA